jgi:Flp pilus assembly protein TadB
MLALRIGFTVAVLAVVVWLLSTGRPLGGLLIVPIIAVWIRRSAESGRLTRFGKGSARPS